MGAGLNGANSNVQLVELNGKLSPAEGFEILFA